MKYFVTIKEDNIKDKEVYKAIVNYIKPHFEYIQYSLENNTVKGNFMINDDTYHLHMITDKKPNNKVKYYLKTFLFKPYIYTVPIKSFIKVENYISKENTSYLLDEHRKFIEHNKRTIQWKKL